MNKSGIFSLEGFAYQIKVFIYYLASLEENSTLGYETYDDIALQKNDVDKEKQQDKLHTYNGLLESASGITALQVKHTTLSNEDYEKVLFNWILLKNDHNNIQKYVLLVDKSYDNKDSVFNMDIKQLFNKIMSTTRTNAALITKVKNAIPDYTTFCDLWNEIKSKYVFQEITNVDDEISNAYRDVFNKGGIMDVNFSLRIKELVQIIQYEILENISTKNSYTCSYSKFRHIIENINSCVRDDFYLPSYSDFKRSSKLDITRKEILKSRQYIQLSKCKLPENMLKEHLIFEEYYNSYKLRKLENIKMNEINDIEGTTYNNFEMTKLSLNASGRDIPINRLTQTMCQDNSHTPNTQIRQGSAIHLTKSETEKSLLISWEDEQ